MRLLLTIIAALTLGLTAHAQAPGYMGKKHQFMYTPSVAMYGAQYRKQSNLLRLFYLNHRFEYDYVLHKRKSLGLVYEFAGYDLNLNRYDLDDENIDTRYTRHQLGLSYKRYSKHSIAPWGFYWKFAFYMAFIKAEVQSSAIPPSYDVKDFEYTSIEPVVGVGLGREIVIGKWVPMNFGFDLNLPMLSIIANDNDPLETLARRTTLGSSLLRFNIGIGILAF